MCIVQGDQKRSGRYLAKAVQNGMETVGRSLVYPVAGVRRSERLRSQQGFKGLTNETEGEGSFGQVGPAHTYRHAARRELQGVVEERGLAQPRLPQDEQGPALAVYGVVQERSDR
jgi:hypothetical protein